MFSSSLFLPVSRVPALIMFKIFDRSLGTRVCLSFSDVRVKTHKKTLQQRRREAEEAEKKHQRPKERSEEDVQKRAKAAEERKLRVEEKRKEMILRNKRRQEELEQRKREPAKAGAPTARAPTSDEDEDVIDLEKALQEADEASAPKKARKKTAT